MNVRSLPAAERDLDLIFSYIAIDNLAAARTTVARIRQRFESLSRFPEQGSPITRNRRRLIVSGTPYVAYYRIIDGAVLVLRVLHGRQHRS